jgi:hypothetical protein
VLCALRISSSLTCKRSGPQARGRAQGKQFLALKQFRYESVVYNTVYTEKNLERILGCTIIEKNITIHFWTESRIMFS